MTNERNDEQVERVAPMKITSAALNQESQS